MFFCMKHALILFSHHYNQLFWRITFWMKDWRCWVFVVQSISIPLTKPSNTSRCVLQIWVSLPPNDSSSVAKGSIQDQFPCSRRRFTLLWLWGEGPKGQPSKARKCSFCVPSLEESWPLPIDWYWASGTSQYKMYKSPFSPVQSVFSKTIVSCGVHWISSTLVYFIYQSSKSIAIHRQNHRLTTNIPTLHDQLISNHRCLNCWALSDPLPETNNHG